MNIYEMKLFQITNPEKGKKLNLYDYSNPESCDICSTSLVESIFFIDGALKGDTLWANMCPKCFYSSGQGLGFGKGQLYMKQPGGKRVMSAGFPPEEKEDIEWLLGNS